MTEKKKSNNFLSHIIKADLEQNRVKNNTVITRFPPEPNGYLHIGHTKSICLNFGLAEEFGGQCHLRFDDTNPDTEEEEYIKAIQEDVKWLGFDWGKNLFFASDYFEQLYKWALELIEKNLAYVDEQSIEEIRANRGSLKDPGKNSPFRNRSVEENLTLFEKMKSGGFEEGEAVLRAKIDMKSPNMNFRDPILYRVRKSEHPRTGDKWVIYPMYDFAHGQEDAIENVTHSICTLEFEDHRPLYEWFIENLSVPSKPRQYEFARLNLDYTVMSKRKLLELVKENHVDGWDDPRMPTIRGMKRRGYPASAIREFCSRIGVTRKNSIIALSTLESCIRENLDETANRVMAVLDPIKVVITNLNDSEILEGSINPKNPDLGKRKIPFSNTIYIERSDFMETPPPKYHRLSPGGEVRLRYAYVLRCDEVIKDEKGEVIELRCQYFPETKGGKKPSDGRKIKGIVHWVDGKDHIKANVHLYDRLFSVENPLGNKDEDYRNFLNKNSLVTINDGLIEKSFLDMKSESPFQFERLGYFVLDSKTSNDDQFVFNRTITLKDNWAK